MANRWGNVATVSDFIFGVSKITADGDCSHEIKIRLLLGRIVDQSRHHIKKQTILCQQRPVLPRLWFFQWSCVDVSLDYKESWALKNGCFWTVVLEKTLESLLDCREIQPVHPKGDQSWVFTGRTDVEAETPIFWPPDVKSWLIWKDPDAGKDWGQEEKETTEDETVRWHHPLNGHEIQYTPVVGHGQEGLVCCSLWGRKESYMPEQLNWTDWNVGFPGGTSGKKSACQCRRDGFGPWVRKIPWSRKWQPTPVFLPGKSHGQKSLAGNSPWVIKKSDMTECLKNFFSNIFCHPRSSF